MQASRLRKTVQRIAPKRWASAARWYRSQYRRTGDENYRELWAYLRRRIAHSARTLGGPQ